MASTDPNTMPDVEKAPTAGSHAPSTVPPGGYAPGPNGAPPQAYDYGGNPMAHIHSHGGDARLAAFGGEFQPGLYRAPKRNLANPAPLGLSAFALTTFVLSLINVNARGVEEPNVALAAAFGYGGLVQLLAGMWEMAVGNTFGATALSSYGGFWISYAILLVPGFHALDAYPEAQHASVLGFFLAGWFIFTFILLMCTLRSTVMFFLLFLTLDLAFLFLAIGEFQMGKGEMGTALSCKHAGGGFGLLAAFLAWYNAFAGIADSSNSFFLIPVFHFPWSEKAREAKATKTS